jgi:hypothetical protein
MIYMKFIMRNIIHIIYLAYLSVISSNVVNVEIVRTLFYETQQDLRTILVSIDNIPTDRLNINIVPSDDSSIVFPNIIRYTRSSSIQAPTEIAFIAGNYGNNTISILIEGINKLDYIVKFKNDNDQIIIISKTKEPNKPIPNSAIYSNDAISVILSFDSNTNKGGYINTFKCEDLLDFYGNVKSICSWINLTHIEILSSSYSTVGSEITVINNKILPYCEYMTCISNYVEETILYISEPINPIKPIISISTSNIIGGCDSIILDLSNSYGSGGKPWKHILFTVTSTDMISASIIEQFLNNNYIISPPTSIQSYLFNNGYNYTFKVDVCNFINICGSGITDIVVLSSTDIPVAIINGPHTRQIISNEQFTIHSTAYTSTCNGKRTTTGLTYNWHIYNNNTILPILSESKDPSKFKLSPNRLYYGNNYKISLTVSNTDGKQTIVSTHVSVTIPPLIISVKGNSQRTINVGDIIKIETIQYINQNILQYNWNCIKISPSIGDCNIGGDMTVNNDFLLLSTDNSIVNELNRITVTVYDDKSRSATTYVDIKFAMPDSPVVSITSSIDDLKNINPSNNIVITGMVLIKSITCNATWFMNKEPLLENTVLSPSVIPIQPNIPKSVNIVIAPNILTPRTSYVFDLTCKDVVSSIELYTNGAPLPGLFSVNPLSGIEFETTFIFAASQWTDPDLPITYSFGFKSNSGNMIIQGRSELSYSESVLPSGQDTNNNIQNCILSVYDNLDSSIEIIMNVAVSRTSINSMQTMIETQLNSMQTSSTNHIKQTLSIISTALNTVNCSGTNCSIINREDCSTIAFTCGNCLPGFIGDYGNRNSLCIDSHSTFPIISKKCDNFCSGHGNCIMIHSDTGMQIEECNEGDITCDPMCDCIDGYYGRICANTQTEIESKQNIRYSLVNSLSTLIQNEDTSIDTITSWVSTITSLTENSDEISTDSTQIAQHIIENILNEVSTTGISYDVIHNILKVCDSSTIQISDRRRLNNNINVDKTIAKTIGLIGKYGRYVSTQLYPGQDDVVTILDSFRMTTSATLNNEIFTTLPLTENEQRSGVVASSIFITNSTDLKLTTITTKAKQFGIIGNEFNSNPIHLQIDGNTLSDVIVILQNIAPVIFETKNSSIQYLHNCSDGEISTTNIICPDSGFSFDFVCNGWIDYMNATCPSQTQEPGCNILNIDNSTNMCRMISYTSTNTTCSCSINIDVNSGRRLNTLDDIGATDLVATSKFVVNQFAGTISYPPEFNSWDDIKKVMIVLLMYIILWTSGLGLITICIIKRWTNQTNIKSKQFEIIKQIKLAGNLKSPIAIHQYLSDYINSIFPEVFREKPFFTRMYNELIKNHRYIYLLTSSGKGTDNKRILIGIQLLTTQTMLMFLMAVFYELEGPDDDGTCQLYDSKSTCLKRASILDYSQTYCKYDSQTNICSYKEPEFSWKSIAIIGMIIAFSTCIFTSPLDVLFNLISAPIKLGKSKNKIKPIITDFSPQSVVYNSIFDKLKKKILNNIFTAQPEFRELPFETDTAYNMAKSSMKVATNMIQLNNIKHNDEIHTMKTQTTDKHFFGDSNSDIDSDLFNQPLNQFDKLVDDITHQRRDIDITIDITKLDEFDNEWGIDPMGNFLKQTKYNYKLCSYTTIDTELILRNELDVILCETSKKLEKFKYLNDKNIGLEMLHIFILDLLGRDSIAAKIFITKTNEDYSYTKTVSARTKGIAWLSIIIMNLFFIYYSIIRGIIRGKSWQYAYLSGCIAQILFEIIIAETFEITWVHFFIPNLVSNEVKNVWDTIMKTINNITTIEQSDSEYFFNASQYLFVSNKLAKKYPELPESNIITAYHNHLPGQISKKWQINRTTLMGLDNTNNTWIRFLSFNTIITILKLLGASPFVVQRMIIRILSPVFTAATTFVCINIIQNPIYMSLFGIISITSISRIYYKHKNKNKNKHKHKTVSSTQ